MFRFKIKVNHNSEMLSVVFQLILLNNKEKVTAHLQKKPEDVHEKYRELTTLCFAIKNSANDSLNVLMDYDADPKTTENGFINNNALIHAVRFQNLYITRILLEKGLSFLENATILSRDVFPEDNVKLLLIIVEYYPAIMANEYVDNDYSEQPLQLAIWLNSLKCLKYLLGANFPPSILIKSSTSPLYYAIKYLNYKAYKAKLSIL